MKSSLFTICIAAGWLIVGVVFLLRSRSVAAALRRFRRQSAAVHVAAFVSVIVAVAIGGSKSDCGTGILHPLSSGGSLSCGHGLFCDTESYVDSTFADLRFSSIAVSSNTVLLEAVWPQDEPLPEAALDVFCSPTLDGPWTLSETVPALFPPLEVVVEINTNSAAAFFRLGTKLDTDGDGLSDAFEGLVSGSSACNPDSDMDGLSDADEISAFTDPLLPDTDGDCVSDFEESLADSDPLLPNAPVAATLRHYRDTDGRLTASFAGACPAFSSSMLSQAGNPRLSLLRNP